MNDIFQFQPNSAQLYVPTYRVILVTGYVASIREDDSKITRDDVSEFHTRDYQWTGHIFSTIIRNVQTNLESCKDYDVLLQTFSKYALN